jgi:hypothetical protein
MGKILESAFDVRDVAKQPVQDVNEMRKLGEQRAAVQVGSAFPVFAGIIFSVTVQ